MTEVYDLAARLVDREVHYCASHLISELIQKAEHFPDYSDDLYNLGSWFDAERKVDGLQVRYIINLDERGDFYATMYQINDEGEDIAVFEVHSSPDRVTPTLTQTPGRKPREAELPVYSASDLVDDDCIDVRDCEAVWDLLHPESLGYADYYLDAGDDVEWIGEDSDELIEAYEHWIISGWFADKLADKGEHVCKDMFGLTIWARTTTGQSMALDHVVQSIAIDLWGSELKENAA